MHSRVHCRLAILLPTVGVVLSVTAAYDFKEAHARVKNLASGTLDKDQTVTFEEMIEHSFYQVSLVDLWLWVKRRKKCPTTSFATKFLLASVRDALDVSRSLVSGLLLG